MMSHPRQHLPVEEFVSAALSEQLALRAARASEEYTYVVRDVRRIVTVGGGLILIMAVLFVLIDVLNVIKL